MRVCLICMGELTEDKFSSKDSEICTVCQEKIAKITNVAYALPERKSKLHSYLLLINAIRERAEKDHEICDFEVNWIYTHPWPVIWDLMGDLERCELYNMGVLR